MSGSGVLGLGLGYVGGLQEWASEIVSAIPDIFEHNPTCTLKSLVELMFFCRGEPVLQTFDH